MSLKESDGELCCPSGDKARVWVSSEAHSVFPERVRVCSSASHFIPLCNFTFVKCILQDSHHSYPLLGWRAEGAIRACVRAGMLPSLSSPCKTLATNRDDKRSATSGNV